MQRYEVEWVDREGRVQTDRFRVEQDAINRRRALRRSGALDVRTNRLTYRLDKAVIYGVITVLLALATVAVGKGMLPINSMDVLVLAMIVAGSAYTSIEVVKYL